MVTKKYFTWIEQVGVNGHKVHIKPTVDNNWPSSLFKVEETSYGFVDMDRRRLGIATFNASAMSTVTSEGDTLFDRLKAEMVHFGVRIVSDAKALELVKEWHGEDFELDGSVIVDNRVEELI